MKTDLNSCLCFCTDGPYKSRDSLVVLVSHQSPHGSERINELLQSPIEGHQIACSRKRSAAHVANVQFQVLTPCQLSRAGLEGPG